MSTLRFAVFGHPIAHSLSPRLHALFASLTGVELEYLAIDASPADFDGAVRSFFEADGRGANVTLPHKAAAFGFADTRTPMADRIRVANILTRLPDGRIEGGSNDGGGMLADLRARFGIHPRGRNVLLLGAGGAARAAAFALLDAGVHTLVIANRTFERAQMLAAALAQPERVGVMRWDALVPRAPFDLIVNATSAGVQHVPLVLPAVLIDADTVAYDLSYGPAARPFVEWAKAAGCARASDGLGMLVETAAASFERWHGVRPDASAALGALRELIP
jgi:shikimate dehydrogenase